jgi:SecD/SecF fusion protein
VDNQERVRNMLQGVAKLQFWEVLELNEYGGAIETINTTWVADQKATPTVADTTSVEELSSEDSLKNALEKQLEQLDPINNANNVSPLISLIKADYGLVYDVRDTITINRIISNERYKSFLPRDLNFFGA